MRTRLTKLKSRRMDNLDASENAFFSRQLELTKTRTYDRKYPNLQARNFVPLDPELDNAVETIRLRSYTNVGIAKLIASYADDLPRADVKTDEQLFSVKSIGTSYGYNLQEIRAAQRAGVAGVVCSPQEVAMLRAQCGPGFLVVTPGIRPAWSASGDQKRITTPAEAIARGADHLVIGRPITQAEDPAAALRRICDEIGAAR
jgi:hypothetical protein